MSKVYNINFQKLFKSLNLGEIKGSPERVYGGLIHRLFKVNTDRILYSVKALNPNIMAKDSAAEEFTNSEKTAITFQKKHISCLPANTINNNIVHCVDGQYYILYSWIEGENLTFKTIDKEVCYKIGSLLAELHNTSISTFGVKESINPSNISNINVNWENFVKRGNGKPWQSIIKDNLSAIQLWTEKGNVAKQYNNKNLIISHKDLDIKNVLWNNNQPTIIDWESAGYTNPYEELMQVALYWSGYINRTINKDLFLAVLEGYEYKININCVNWDMILNNIYYNMLDWLHYNLKRSLNEECADKEEQKIGTEQSYKIIMALKNYYNTTSQIKSWIKDRKK